MAIAPLPGQRHFIADAVELKLNIKAGNERKVPLQIRFAFFACAADLSMLFKDGSPSTHDKTMMLGLENTSLADGDVFSEN
jgi:hypothetical protein